MDKPTNNLCSGCLSSDRHLLFIEDRSKKQSFFQIINEMSMLYLKEEQLKLCWECDAYLRKWVKFKERVKNSYKIMHDVANLSLLRKNQSNLTGEKIFSFKISPSPQEDDVLKIIKDENKCYVSEVIHNAINQLVKDDLAPQNPLSLIDNDKNLTNDDVYVVNNDNYPLNNDSETSDTMYQDNIKVITEVEDCTDIKNISENNIDESKNDVTPLVDGLQDVIDLSAVKVEEDLLNDSEDEFLVNLCKVYVKKRRKKKGLTSKENKSDYLNRKATTKKKSKEKEKSKKESQFYKEVSLNTEEIESERKMAALREDYINAMFRCERCLTSFPNADDLGDHLRLKHEMHAMKHKCVICECSFSSFVTYKYHKNRHKIRYECLVCEQRFATVRTVMKHHETVHWHSLEGSFKLNNVAIKDEMTKTEDSNCNGGQVSRYPCEFCEKTFKWKTSLRKHMETHRIETGQMRKPYCEPCGLSFTTTSNLQKHVKCSSNHQIQLQLRKLKDSNMDEEQPSADRQVSRVEQIRSTVMKSTQQFLCPHCDRKFQWMGNLRRHVLSHAARANGELVCKPCNRSFSSIETYNQHMRISKKHVSENVFKFVCSECGKRFSNKIKLKDHVDWEHLKNYVHTCALCDKIFKSRTTLLLHNKAVHRKDGLEHLCDHCGKAFTNRGKLRTHIVALHTNESPYKCGVCSARFNWQACLSRHLRKVHGGQKKQKLDNGS